MLLRLRRNVAREVGQSPRDGHADGRSGVGRSARRASERVLELLSSLAQLGRALLRPHSRGDDLVVKGRHEHLDPVVAHDANAVEQVLFRSQRPRYFTRRRSRELVDQLVDPPAASTDAAAPPTS